SRASSTAPTSTRRRSAWSPRSSSGAPRSFLCSPPRPGPGSALASEPRFGAVTEQLLDLLKEARAVGLVFVGDELTRGHRLVSLRVRLRLTVVATQRPSPTFEVGPVERTAGWRARTAPNRRTPPRV